jgi:hypothetical protein
MKLLRTIAAGWMGLMALAAAAAPAPWEQPVAALAAQIAGVLGPCQISLAMRNLSSISNDELPVIRRLLELDLNARGITIAGAQSANTVRVTLSQSARERLLVAEVGEGSQTQVALVDLGPLPSQRAPQAGPGKAWAE